MKRFWPLLIVPAQAGWLFFVPQSEPFKASEYFRGQTLRIIVGHPPGGGYDAYARLFAAHLGKHLPGNPRTRIVNMPGAGNQRAVRYGLSSDPDGLTMVLIPKGLIIQELLGQDVRGFDYQTARYLGLPDGERQPWALWVRADVARSWDEVMSRSEPLLNGTTRVGVETAIVIDWLEMVGAPVRNVIGYSGSAEVMAAFNRGEVHATIYASYVSRVRSAYPEWLSRDPPFMVPVLRWGGAFSEDLLASGGWQQPPEVLEVTSHTAVQREAFEMWRELQFGTKMFALPPGVGEEVYRALKAAFEATVLDPAFEADARARNLLYGLVTAEELQASVRRINEASPEARAILRKLYTGH